MALSSRPSEFPQLIVPAIVLALSVVACSAMPPVADAGPGAPGQCNAEAVRWVVGQAPSDELVARARGESGSSSVRVIRPGDAYTEDLRPDRLNLNVNERGAIVGASCG